MGVSQCMSVSTKRNFHSVDAKREANIQTTVYNLFNHAHVAQFAPGTQTSCYFFQIFETSGYLVLFFFYRVDTLLKKNLAMEIKITDVVSNSSTTIAPLTPEEEDAIVTLIVVVVGIAAIIILFLLAAFFDCRQQKRDLITKKQMRLKISQKNRSKKSDDKQSLAKDMCPNSVTNFGATSISDAMV